MSSSAVLGQFLWHELVTPDPAAGAGFYSKVLGWSASPWEGQADYTMLSHDKGPVGGARVVGKDDLADKAGANWLTYVGVPDLAAALATAQSKGGRVLHPVTQIASGGGRYAVIADPQGAHIGLYEPGSGMSGESGDAGPSAVAWHELTTEDPDAALRFYKDLFDWDVVATHPMGGDVGNYFLFGKGTTQMGGVFRRSANLPPTWPRWLVYLGVPGVAKAAEATLAAGGKILNGPHQVPGGGWIAQVLDSHGVAVALHGPKEAPVAKAPAKAKAAAKPKAEVKPAAAPKAKSKVKTKVKTKAKAKKAVQAKAKAKPKAQAKAKTKAKSKAAPKRKATKPKAKAKTKSRPKAKARAKSRKAPRRGK